MAVYGYARVSKQSQVDRGESLQVQERRIKAHALMLDVEVTETFIERGVSAGRPFASRPEGRKLFTLVKRGDTVIASKLDRMFRSALDAQQVYSELAKRGASLHLIDLGGDVMGNGMAKMFFAIVSAFAEGERDRIKDRISEVKEDQRERGMYLGGRVPFGYTVNCDSGALEAVAKEQAIIRRMVRLRASGKSLRSIADTFKGEGVDVSHAGVKKIVAAAQAKAA